jgi:cysteinyl-tRNA synthetase
LWEQIHRIEEMFHTGLRQHEPEDVTRSLLELDRIIWQSHEAMEDQQDISQAREKLRDLIVVLGTKLASVPRSETACLMPVVEGLLNLRQQFRKNRQWAEADAIRDTLERSHISIKDTPEGSSWHLKS